MLHFLDSSGLLYFWSKIKAYISSVASKTTVSFSEGTLIINSNDAVDNRDG